MRPSVTCLLLAAVVAGCASPAPKPGDSAPVESPPVALPPVRGGTGDQEWDKAVVAQLERDARALATTSGCADAGGCRVAPVGVKACGGPRDYIAYCVTATDTAALFRKLDELARAEREYNARYGVMSTCEFREAPPVALVGQTCRTMP